MPPHTLQPRVAGSLPVVNDELAWELLRDEWELLLAVGNGPTSVAEAAAALDMGSARHGELKERLDVLAQHGVCYRSDLGFGLVSAVHVRQEGMASFLKDLVIKRLELGNEQPFAVGYCRQTGEGDMKPFLAAADERLFPDVFEALQAPAIGDERHAVTFIFAVASDVADHEVSDDLDGFMTVLRAAARERSSVQTRDGADLKLADTRNDMADVQKVARLCEQFFADGVETAGFGAAAFAMLLRPMGRRGQARLEVTNRED